MRRIVTSHNEKGEAIISRDTQIISQILPHGVGSAQIWSSDSSPADVASSDDKGDVEAGFVSGGSIFRVVDVPPRSTGALHRSISLDYIIVQRGTVVLNLDDGSRTKVDPGGIVVQQATMHGWDNQGDEWARLLCIMLPAKAPVVGGKELRTDLGALFALGN
ncbi:hypothetical protein A1O1_01432 [Capronia coronata CBS 617.96]|uniref:Cupin 2 conserved barrel domain-containing protein n=1 Tax=Capronia coronata CBS 617.96 TaxID=1182541 RepID=W9Z3Y8_9EURO|nr:uncharacterized protein A1O1_01432 [Capronia coronata CBS 617.96]EXJ96306.1 hypothetical protein A1O1_01432 [Capronia coronata CBS 617.96]